MPITDLTNTTWYFNETLDHCGISNQESFEIGAMAAEFMINYYAGNNYPYTSLYYEFSMSDNVYYDPNYDPTYDFVPYEGGSWTDEDCRTIWITGGDDATNPDLISWLTQNATQVENPTVITDVTNTSWHFNEVLHHWNVGEVDEEESSVRYNDFRNITFNANGENFNYLGYRGHRHDDFVSGTPLTVSYNETNVYDTDSWVDEAYKTITVTGGDDATNPKFIVWLTKNATQVSIEDIPSGITISYNDAVIATVQPGETATLECAGMKMEGNIVVEAPEASGGGGAEIPLRTVTYAVGEGFNTVKFIYVTVEDGSLVEKETEAAANSTGSITLISGTGCQVESTAVTDSSTGEESYPGININDRSTGLYVGSGGADFALQYVPALDLEDHLEITTMGGAGEW